MMWWQSAVVYQIYPRSFQDSNGDGIGDIPGIISRLDYLKYLGVDVVWICPLYKSPNVDGGYDISDYRAIAAEFGTMADFERLLTEAHARGLKIVMDLVVNHTSNLHPWFIESRSSRDSAKRDWYIWRDGSGNNAPNKLESFFSGSVWEKDDKSGQYYLHMFAKEQPDLNWKNADVRDAVYDTMTWWLEKGVDGFRMDVINMISKPEGTVAPSGGDGENCMNGPNVHEYLREMNRKVLSKYNIITVGETPGVTTEQAEHYAGFDTGELNMVFQFELMDIDSGKYGKWELRRFALEDMKRIFSKWQTGLYGKAWNSLYWSNHDQPRAVSRFGDTGTPLYWEKSSKMLATCLHMMQGTPYIFQGEEIGMTNAPLDGLNDLRDIESLNAYDDLVRQRSIFTHDEMMARIKKAGRDNARTPMQWDDKKNAGFSAGKPWIGVNPNYTSINVERQAPDKNSILNYYKRLIQIRKENPVIVYGDYELLLPDDKQLFVFRRRFKDVSLLVMCNFSGKPVHVTDELYQFMQKGQPLILNYEGTDSTGRELAAYEARVFRIV